MLIKWSQLSSDIKVCHKCEGMNDVEAGTLNAPGYGSVTSEVMIIGQSLCGTPCIKKQIPFTGGSGLLLDKAFEKAGVEKKDIYITNVVKCHPPNNRKSLPHEIKNCVAYLNKELEWLHPSHIICLGKDAAAVFDGAMGAPTVHTADKTEIHYLYHPSYIKRKPKSEQAAYIDSVASIINESKRGG